MTKEEEKKTKPIRTFVRRQGRMTIAQERALKELMPKYGLSIDSGFIDFKKLFPTAKEIVLEIGFGMGESLIEMAKQMPDSGFLGIEVHEPGVGACLNSIEKNGLSNVRVIADDAINVLKQAVFDNSLDKVLIYFPDPWPKKRHHKRRIVQLDFLNLIHKKLKENAILHLATDWEPYAKWMMDELSQFGGFKNLAGKNEFSKRPDWRVTTKFERRGERLGHGIWDLLFKKV